MSQENAAKLSAEDARAEAERDTLRAKELGSNLLHPVPVEGDSSANTFLQKAPIFGEGGKVNSEGQRDLLDEAQGGF